MAVKLLTKKGTVITRKPVWALTRVQMEEQAEALKELAEGVKGRLGDSIPDNKLVGDLENPLEDVQGGIFAALDEAVIWPADDASGNPMVTAREFTPETLDEYLGCKVSLPYGGKCEALSFKGVRGISMVSLVVSGTRTISLTHANTRLCSRLMELSVFIPRT